MITPRSKERFIQSREQYKQEYKSARAISNIYGEKALYTLDKEE